MKVIKVSVLCALLGGLPISGYADDHQGYYLSGSFIAGLSDVEGFSATSPIPSTPRESDQDDAVGGFAGSVGYGWDSFRLALEYSWRYRFDFDNRFGSAGDPAQSGLKNDLMTHSIFTNFYWDFHNKSAFTPFLVGGVGWVIHDSDATKTILATNAVDKQDNTSHDFGWSLGAGISYDINQNWKAGVTYRYTDLGEPEIDTFANGGTISVDEYTSHDFTIDVRYQF